MSSYQKTKTVYVIGAGFSVEANAPSQEKLVGKIFELNESHPSIFPPGKVEEFKNFLKSTLHIPEDLHKTVPLEDIFTPMDSCISQNVSFQNLGSENLKQKRQLVFELIGLTLQHLLRSSDKRYIQNFAKFLVHSSISRSNNNYRRNDPVSVISTNWDILLDNSIFQEIQLSRQLGVVDYCCHISSYDENDEQVKPGLEILGKGGYNVKLLKLHGSLNWLQCPRCHRIYVKFYEKIGVLPFQEIHKPSCRHCNKNFESLDSHRLVSNLIMPTYLKDLSNPQYKVIWQNAGIELSEAKKIVFIGYSLPQADFEMRQLLARMVDRNTEIEVVDFKDPEYPQKYEHLIQSFRQFFGREIKDFPHGTSSFVEKELEPTLKNTLPPEVGDYE